MITRSNFRLIEYINDVIEIKEDKVKEDNKVKEAFVVNIEKNVNIKEVRLYIKKNIIFVIN